MPVAADRRPRRLYAGAAVLVVGLMSASAASALSRPDPHTPASPPAPASLSPSSGVARRTAIPDTAFRIPKGALFVKSGGSDHNDGTQTRPLRSVGRAVALAKAGGTVVLGTGVYRESLGSIAKPITIQAAPHAAPWLSGSDVVTSWSAVSGAWVHHNWTAQFCENCYDPRAIDPKFPYAGLADMAFINGRPLTQVGHRGELAAGRFFVDYAAHDLYVGDNPTGPHTVVEATTRVQAARFNSAAAGSVVRGIGFERYAAYWNASPSPAMVLDAAPSMTFDSDVFTESASRGLSVYSTGAIVRNSAFVHNGFTGLHANKADHLDIERNLVAANNSERWFPGFSAVASVSGIKIAATQHVLVKGNVVQDNDANGIWFDVSCYDVTIVDNLAQRNYRNGIYVEITGTAIVASNLSILNGQGGLKLSGATDARVYNNTLADNVQYQLSVHDDGRNNTDPSQIKLGITWNTARNVFANNILSAPNGATSGALLYTEDLDKPKIVDASTMIAGMTADVYARSGPVRPRLLALWTRPASKPLSKYLTLSSFRAATGYEARAIEYVGYPTSPIFVDPQRGNYALRPGSALHKSGAPLPADIAAAIGVACAAGRNTADGNTVGARSLGPVSESVAVAAPALAPGASARCTAPVDRGALVHPS